MYCYQFSVVLNYMRIEEKSPMKKALIAIDHLNIDEDASEHFFDAVNFFELKGIFSQATIASVVHASQFLMSYSLYTKHTEELAREVGESVRIKCSGRFQFSKVKVIKSESHHNEDVVEHLSKYGRRSGMDMMVFGSSDRKGLPHWFLGSISETASLTARLPVLIFKPKMSSLDFSRVTNFVVAIDVSAPPSPSAITWISKLAKGSDAKIHLLYVEPKRKSLIGGLRDEPSSVTANRVLRRIQNALEKENLSVGCHIRKETTSVPHVIVSFCDERKSLLAVMTSPERSKARRLFLGSTSRQVLALTSRPFLSLRME